MKSKNKGSFVEWQQIACGGYHTVGVNQEGNLVSWGSGLRGQLGHGNNRDQRIEPTILEKALFSKQVEHVACGLNHTLVVTTEGELYSW